MNQIYEFNQLFSFFDKDGEAPTQVRKRKQTSGPSALALRAQGGKQDALLSPLTLGVSSLSQGHCPKSPAWILLLVAGTGTAVEERPHLQKARGLPLRQPRSWSFV